MHPDFLCLHLCYQSTRYLTGHVCFHPINPGSFGKVYKAWDTKDNIYVALKVIKSKRPFTMQAKVEVNILELLRDRDPEGKYNCGKRPR